MNERPRRTGTSGAVAPRTAKVVVFRQWRPLPPNGKLWHMAPSLASKVFHLGAAQIREASGNST